MGDIINVAVKVDTAGTAINNAEAIINFPADYFEVISISKSNSIFSLWVEEPAFNNKSGTVSFGGGLPTPGYNGKSGQVLTFVLRAEKAGDATILFSSGAVRANDGMGTDVLKSKIPAKITITAPKVVVPVVAPKVEISAPAVQVEQPTPQAKEVEKPVGLRDTSIPASPAIKSNTNPDISAWYKDASPVFSWDLDPVARAVKIGYDSNPNGRTLKLYYPAIKEKQLGPLKSGTYYFHAQFANDAGWSDTAHFRFNIDIDEPQIIAASINDASSTSEFSRTILVQAKDKDSGLAEFKVRVPRGAEMKATPDADGKAAINIDLVQFGSQDILLEAFDKAGNSTSTKLNIKVDELQEPTIEVYQQEISQGDTLLVSGKNPYSNGFVVVWLSKPIGAPTKYLARSDMAGNYELNIIDVQNPGEYRVWAQSVVSRELVGPETQKLSVYSLSKAEKPASIISYVGLPSVWNVAALILAFIVSLVAYFRILYLKQKIEMQDELLNQMREVLRPGTRITKSQAIQIKPKEATKIEANKLQN